MNKWYYALPVLLLSHSPVWADKQLSDTVGIVTDTEVSDPNGFKLMLVCWGLLFLVFASLMGVTIWYYLKSKKAD